MERMGSERQGFLRGVRLRRDQVADFTVYPFDIPAVRDLHTLDLDPRVTFLVGENGCGKSTLVEALAIVAGFNAEGGSRNFSFAVRPSESPLHRFLQPIRGSRREKTGFFLRAETMFNVATEVERSALAKYGWDDLHAKSHGEGFFWVMTERFGANGLYLLDEPESALSPQRQLAMLRHMHDLVGRGSQFIIATHSPILMAYPAARILLLDETGMRQVGYKETWHYQLTKAFLDHPDDFLRRLLEE